MKTIEIKGKTYIPVNERVKEFRAKYPDYSLITEIVELTDGICTILAKVIDKDGRIIATGLAREERDDRTSMVNKTSYVENCETSAWGRALGNFGIGIDESIASADEVARAIAQQGSQTPNIERKAQVKQSVEKNDELTLDKAYGLISTKGKMYGELSDEQLQYIVDKSGSALSRKAAQMILDDRRTSEDLMPLEVEEGLPF